jgi:hypothetical protein
MHSLFKDTAYNLPHTIAYAVRKQSQIDSFFELPKKKRPPRSIWHNEYKLNKWYDNIYDDKNNVEENGELVITLDEVD